MVSEKRIFECEAQGLLATTGSFESVERVPRKVENLDVEIEVDFR